MWSRPPAFAHPVASATVLTVIGMLGVMLGLMLAVPRAGAAELSAPPGGRSPLAGQVLDPDGRAVGRARVFIYTASPREGTSSLCPSCYPECGKSATTERDGRFAIAGLNDSLRYRVLVVARGFEPVFAERVDHLEGPVELKLARRRPDRLDPHHSLRGRVVDPLGRPVVGAKLEPFGFHRVMADGRSMMRFGPTAGTDPLAITDDRGEFAIALGDSGVGWFIRVRSRDLAPLLLRQQPAQATPIRVAMRYGGTVTGRVTSQGKPLPGVRVGLVQADRAGQTMAYGNDQIATDERGVFTFVNVTAGEDYFVHGIMESLAEVGVLDTTRVHVPGDDTVRDLGALAVTPGRRIAGRVVLSDGQPIPPKTRLLLDLDGALDAQNQVLSEDGRFEFRGVPRVDARLHVRVRGYRFARETDGYSEAIGFPHCAVAADREAGDLRLVLEPGDPQPVPVSGKPKP